MNKFKIGDKVAAYNAGRANIRQIGFIHSIDEYEIIYVDVGKNCLDHFHHKQLRKIKPKKSKLDYIKEGMMFVIYHSFRLEGKPITKENTDKAIELFLRLYENKKMSDLEIRGYGKDHDWEDLGTNQHPDKNERYTYWKCKKCYVSFRHFYHITPIIYDAIKDNGVPDKCLNTEK